MLAFFKVAVGGHDDAGNVTGLATFKPFKDVPLMQGSRTRDLLTDDHTCSLILGDSRRGHSIGENAISQD